MESMMEPSGGHRICVKCCLIPQRYLTALMMFLGIVSAFATRVFLTVILKYFVENPTNQTKSFSSKNVCNFTTIVKHRPKHVEEEYFINWDADDVTEINTVFFYGQLISHFPSGYLADRYGGKHVFGLSVLSSGLLTLSMAGLIKATRAPLSVKIIRFLTGITEGALFPASSSLISSWTPKRERGTVGGIVFCASQFSNFVNNVGTVMILRSSWLNVFYAYGGTAVMWWMFWCVLGYSEPKQNIFISEKEKKYLDVELSRNIPFKEKEFPWSKMLASLSLWSFVVVQWGHAWTWTIMTKDLPDYLIQILRFDVETSHMFSSFPFIVMAFLTLTMGIVSDILVNGQYLTVDSLRKIFTTIGAMGPGIFILSASFSGCNRYLPVVMFSLAMGLMSFYYVGTRVIALDLAPNYSGCIMGIVNGLGSLAGVVQPHITKMVSNKQNSMATWRKLFLISLGILAFTNLIFIIFGSAREQSWNNRKKSKEETEHKNL